MYRNWPKRKVVDEERYTPVSAPRGAYAKTLTLECGHTVRRKGSIKTPEHVHCAWCYAKEANDDRRTQ